MLLLSVLLQRRLKRSSALVIHSLRLPGGGFLEACVKPFFVCIYLLSRADPRIDLTPVFIFAALSWRDAEDRANKWSAFGLLHYFQRFGFGQDFGAVFYDHGLSGFCLPLVDIALMQFYLSVGAFLDGLLFL
jgi:hypothetical protein